MHTKKPKHHSTMDLQAVIWGQQSYGTIEPNDTAARTWKALRRCGPKETEEKRLTIWGLEIVEDDSLSVVLLSELYFIHWFIAQMIKESRVEEPTRIKRHHNHYWNLESDDITNNEGWRLEVQNPCHDMSACNDASANTAGE